MQAQDKYQYRLTIGRDPHPDLYTTHAHIGGLAIEENLYRFPSLVLSQLREMSEQSVSKSVDIRVRVVCNLTHAQIMSNPVLQKGFANSYESLIGHRFRGQNPLDQRPFVRDAALFPVLAHWVGTQDAWQGFKVIQKPLDVASPIVRFDLSFADKKAIDVLKLLCLWAEEGSD